MCYLLVRAVRELEKKVGAELEEQVQVMQQSLVGMARESEQLRAELMRRRVRGPGKFAFLLYFNLLHNYVVILYNLRILNIIDMQNQS